MNSQDNSESSPGNKKFHGKTVGGLALVGLLAVYSFAQPVINEKFGLNLPGLRQDAQGQVVADNNGQTKSATAKKADNKAESKTPTRTSPKTDSKTSPKSPENAKPGKSTIARGPLSARLKPTKDATSTPAASQPKAKPGGDPNLKYGLLRDVGRETFMSPSGLQYTRGSAEGHRLEHLRRHTEDQPGRPGSHGVFDGGMEGALKTIDLAYEKAKKGIKTTKSKDRDRTIYTVDMGKRVGFVGGRTGNQRRKPMARRVKIILEGTRVITAYPL